MARKDRIEPGLLTPPPAPILTLELGNGTKCSWDKRAMAGTDGRYGLRFAEPGRARRGGVFMRRPADCREGATGAGQDEQVSDGGLRSGTVGRGVGGDTSGFALTFDKSV